MKKSTKINEEQMFDIRKGIMLYSYKRFNKNEIRRLYNLFIEMTNAEFKYYFSEDAYYKK